MSKTILMTVAAAIVFGGVPAIATAQSPSRTGTPASTSQQVVTMYELVLRDGSRLYGNIERQDDLEIVFRTQGGTTVTVKREDVLSLRQTTGTIAEGEFQPGDPNATRLFFGPTGRALRRGQTYLGTYEVVLPFVQVGITDRISIGGGTPLMFGGGESNRPFWITPKVQILDRPSTQVAVGAMHGFAGLDDSAGIAYAVATQGNIASSLTIGAGVAYSGRGGRAGVVMVGGERQFRRNMKFITENYIWKGGHGFGMFGVRFFGERLSADLGLAIPFGTSDFFGAPVVNFVYLF
jgi:hypothetical protein